MPEAAPLEGLWEGSLVPSGLPTALRSYLRGSASTGGSGQVPPTSAASCLHPTPPPQALHRGPLLPPGLGEGVGFREQWNLPTQHLPLAHPRARKLNIPRMVSSHTTHECPASRRRGFCEAAHLCPAGFPQL